MRLRPVARLQDCTVSTVAVCTVLRAEGRFRRIIAKNVIIFMKIFSGTLSNDNGVGWCGDLLFSALRSLLPF